jgi:hypothetical protein
MDVHVQFSFPVTIEIRESQHPVLAAILKECTIQAKVDIACESHHMSVDHIGTEVESLDFNGNGIGPLKAKTLMCPELENNIREELERKINSHWEEYGQKALEHFLTERENALSKYPKPQAWQ